eukprot:TRINITY_DN5927_c0_g1_i2.p1 TRINITY_DN5927_c0_g1~~TRINITY_DN5927_c0_g1_i2.p1  ORF type:complete len:113 (-),score=19.87 TRINITY_DN5927_c0_g1_i2:19-357(-)
MHFSEKMQVWMNILGCETDAWATVLAELDQFQPSGSDGTNELHEEAGSECVYGSITLQFMGILCQELASGRFPRHLQGCHPVFGACPAAALPHLQLSMLLMLASRALHLESA